MRFDSIFDVIGHIMVGPSSSHTAGACNIGLVINKIFGSPKKVMVYLHGSFAETGVGHGTDKAIIAGLLGILPDDAKLRQSYEFAKEKGMDFSIKKRELGEKYHENSVLIEFDIELDSGIETLSIIGSSIGGGNILIKEINGIDADFDGKASTLIIIRDVITNDISKTKQLIANFNLDIINSKINNSLENNKSLYWIEVSSDIPDDLVKKINELEDIKIVRALNV